MSVKTFVGKDVSAPTNHNIVLVDGDELGFDGGTLQVENDWMDFRYSTDKDTTFIGKCVETKQE